MNKQKFQLPEIWGGIECTINRVNDRYLDQLNLAGLYHRTEYIDSIIGLGIQQIRFPVLWEKHQPARSTQIDWSFAEHCLNNFRLHNIEPVVGLLHHGSGPSYTNLLKDDFPELFAEYAAKVATQFPRIQYYTPVNEPLTTARFSGLYGFWYPHKKNDVNFIKILLNELKASVRAMQEIRKINPAAKFIQTEDLGKTYSTALLSYQADFENHRRWLTYDILCGSFIQSHPLWDYFMRLGIEMEALQFFIDNPCPPDIIGVNHYLTSERYLDEEVDNYPVETRGGNGLHHYADIEAIRVQMEVPHGLEPLLKEIWQRYNIPIAITEVHLNCTREEQLRWFNSVYEIAVKVKKEGVDIHAVTAWSLLGSFGWNKLLTCESCDYETGAFDISAGYARPTALSHLIKNLIKGDHFPNHQLMQPGWWKLNSRYFKKNRKASDIQSMVSVQPIIIIGNTGTLGKALSRVCQERNIHHFLLGRPEADICDQDRLIAIINHYHPWAIINAAGYVDVDNAETEKDICYKSNFLGAKNLAIVCKEYNVRLLSFSSDLVFSGDKNIPYVETDLTNPLNTYGHSKQLAEMAVLKQCPEALLIRTAAFFSPWDQYNFVQQLINELEQGNKITVPNDITIAPTYVPHLVNASLDLLIDNMSGIWHLVNKGCITWYEFAKKIVEYTNLDIDLVTAGYNMKTAAERPAFSALSSIKYNLMPSLEEALDMYFLSDRRRNETFTIQNITNERI